MGRGRGREGEKALNRSPSVYTQAGEPSHSALHTQPGSKRRRDREDHRLDVHDSLRHRVNLQQIRYVFKPSEVDRWEETPRDGPNV